MTERIEHIGWDKSFAFAVPFKRSNLPSEKKTEHVRSKQLLRSRVQLFAAQPNG